MISSWRHSPRHPELGGNLRAWLTVPDSLTARLQQLGQGFRVRVVANGREPSLHLDMYAPRLPVRVREVVLCVGDLPVVFAHTELSTAPRGVMHRWLARLGSRSLGSLLFALPNFRRQPLQYRRLDARDELYRRASEYLSLNDHAWARRSAHHLGEQCLLVTEVFAPALSRLSPQGGLTPQGA